MKVSKLTSDRRKVLADMKKNNQASNSMLPGAPESKKRKGKRSDSRIRIPCPLLPAVPAVAPPRKRQPQKRQRSHERIAEAILSGLSVDTSVPNPVMKRTVEDSDDDVIEGMPSRPLLNKRKRKDHCVNPVPANIEFIAFTTCDDMEPELTEPHDSGSEIEMDNISLDSRNVFAYAEFDDLDDHTLDEDIQRTGAEADVALRAMAGPDEGDLLLFDWCSDLNKFEGVREMFTGPSGPTFEITGLTPLEVFKKIWDVYIIDHIVRETNRYAHQVQIKSASKKNSRISRWKDTTGEEIWRFLTIIMLQSFVVNHVELEYWYPSNEELRIGAFADIMTYNRFLLLKKCLHFVDSTFLPVNASQLDKVMPVIKHLNNKFSTMYLPEQNVAIDESLLLSKSRLSRAGMKTYELYESRTGYLWKMQVCSGKGRVRTPQEAIQVHERGNELGSATSQNVYTLIRPLLGKGHTIAMDEFYNAPLLSRLLKTKHKTDTMGTLQLKREFVPESLKSKNKNNMVAGEVSFSTTKDLSVVVWKDRNVVAMISTFHRPEVGVNKIQPNRYRPKVVVDYNVSMGGIDHKDQMINAFPIDRARNSSCYQNLFRRLLNVSVHNALIVYNHGRTRQTQLANRDFRLQLVGQMLQMHCPPVRKQIESPPPTALSQMHLPAKNEKKQRCKLCYEAKVRHTTMWRCSSCQVNLCIEGCYTAYHAKYVIETGQER